VNDILKPFFEELSKEEAKYICFQKDNAPEYTADNSMWTLCAVFNKQMISREPWPTHSPDINVGNIQLFAKLEIKGLQK
jgi:hypothetical protein